MQNFTFHQKKKASAILTAMFILIFLAGINLLISEQARYTILNLRDEQESTNIKILANEFIIHNKKHKIDSYTDLKLGTVRHDDKSHLTIKLKTGHTVEVDFEECGY